ncbi:MAG TPA: hypothetical protein DCE18_17870, partial [Syntrophobacteraceae bacterium]|nr:hypothetical protein [Syntrophobacteraceae bacterium]
MTRAESQDNNDNAMRSWLVLMGIAASFLVWGLLVYVSVGDKGAPNWNFGVVEDIPGQSSYSTHETKRLPSLIPSSETAGQNATRQHVME